MTTFLLPEPPHVKVSAVTLKMLAPLPKMQVVPSWKSSYNGTSEGLMFSGGEGTASLLQSMDTGAEAPLHWQNVLERQVWQLRNVADPRNHLRENEPFPPYRPGHVCALLLGLEPIRTSVASRYCEPRRYWLSAGFPWRTP